MTHDRALAAVPPGAGAAAMSTGIVSIALHLTGAEWFSRLWLVVGVSIWLALVALFVARLAGDRSRWLGEAGTPPALTGVAATAVLGTRFSLLGWHAVAVAALAVAVVAWAVLMPAVLRSWTAPTVGVHFLLCVATQGPAVLGATLSVALSAPWLTGMSLALWALGLVFYAVVFSRFSFAQLKTGAGDQWVIAGALAISAVAAGTLVTSTAAAGWEGWAHDAVRATAALCEALDLLLYAALVVCEIRWPRLRFDLSRWSTAFPMGMSAVAALTVANATGQTWLRPVGLVLVWPAVVLCVILLAASGRRLVGVSAR